MDSSLMERILDVSRRASESRELDMLLRDVIDASISLVGAECGYIVLTGPDDLLDVYVQRGQVGSGPKDVCDCLPNAILHHIIETHQPLVLQDAAHDARFCHSDSKVVSGVQSVMAAPLLSRSKVIGAICVENRSCSDRFTKDDLVPLVLLADQVAADIENARLFGELTQANEQLGMMAEHLAEAEEMERKRLARELHDQAGQKLTALSVSLEIIRVLFAECAAKIAQSDQIVEQLYSRLNDASVLVKETAAHMHNVMGYLRLPALEEQGLLDALEWYGIEFSSRTGIVVDVRGSEGLSEKVSAAIKTAFFRIAQEGLMNVARHAKASRVQVSVILVQGVLRMVIADNGVGFIQQPIKPGERQHWGLLSMTERAKAIGGHCRIESAPGEGTRVIVEVSL
ncbi:MAG: GAF domain-containing sensor histidine kinase [Anaerolineae bacterium]|nr:GAF domain-containing sensor histidine kinase [Anaerolineae bacterium]